MEIRPACDATKLNASQPLSGPNKSMTCTKPYSQSLTRSPEKDSFGFGKGDLVGKVKKGTNGLSTGELYDKYIESCKKGQQATNKFLSGFSNG